MGKRSDEAELAAIASRYALREQQQASKQYSLLRPSAYMPSLERDRAILNLFARLGFNDLGKLTLLEIGCGSGSNLLRMIQWGFYPENLVGNELLPARLAKARHRLPAATRLFGGDACDLDCGDFDIVYQSTVFSSILDDAMQNRLAQRMWDMTRPGGGVLWYDFCYDNPRNADVRGVPVSRVRALFPMSAPVVQRITLAPPVSRFVTRFSSRAYSLLSALPMLRTHALCWIPK